MRKLNVYVDPKHMKQLAAIGKTKGLKVAQLVRLAIAEFVERNQR